MLLCTVEWWTKKTRVSAPLSRRTTRPGTRARHYTLPTAIASHDPPLIGERAAMRGRGATEDGEEHFGVRQPREPEQMAATSTSWRPLVTVEETLALLAAPWRTPMFHRKRPQPTTRPGTRTLLDSLPQERAGASQRKVAMRAPVRKARYPSRRFHLHRALAGYCRGRHQFYERCWRSGPDRTPSVPSSSISYNQTQRVRRPKQAMLAGQFDGGGPYLLWQSGAGRVGVAPLL